MVLFFKRLQRAHFCELMKILCFCSVSHLGNEMPQRTPHASSSGPASGRRASPVSLPLPLCFPSDPQRLDDKVVAHGMLTRSEPEDLVRKLVVDLTRGCPFKALVQYLVPSWSSMLIYKSEKLTVKAIKSKLTISYIFAQFHNEIILIMQYSGSLNS